MRDAVILAVLLASGSAHAEEEVRLPLETWSRTQARLEELRAAVARSRGAQPVIVGETIYRGRSDGRNLRITLSLRAQLAQTDAFKEVPIVGSDAVVLTAKHQGRPIALTQAGARWVWLTRARGAVDLEVELVVPPRGPRGSIEYRFGVVESPVTELLATFAHQDLSPRVTGAVTHRVESAGGGIRLQAILRPTSEIHIVGFHDVEASDAGRQAKLYGETMSLVSISDDGIDLFAVVSLTILYAAERRFRIELPAGYDLVSADGEGAFQYTVEAVDGRQVLVGETALGIRDGYEISLRAKRALAPGERRVTLPSPRLLGVERDAGFVAVEVPGKLSIEGVDGAGLVPIDVRELPEAIIESSVSPVVRAFRYSGERGEASVELARYPERPLDAGGIDHLRATSVVTADGRLMTDLLFTIRNNLQQYLVLTMDPGDEVLSAVLDGNPIKPSRDDQGRVLVPLVRSRGGAAGLVPFRVQLVYERATDGLGALGRRTLELPKLQVPVSSVSWSVWVPGGYRTSRLAAPLYDQVFVKNARWHRGAPAFEHDEGDWGGGTEDMDHEEQVQVQAPGARPDRADRADRASGAMPVRVRLPRAGVELNHRRYWVDGAEPVSVAFTYARTPLVLGGKAAAGLAVLLTVGLLLRRRWRVRPLALAQTAGALLLRQLQHARERLVESFEAEVADFAEWRKRSLPWALMATGGRLAWLGLRITFAGGLLLLLAIQAARLLWLLQHPL